jgi:hypothetical protein
MLAANTWMTLTATGSLGIGTLTPVGPASSLQVGGALTINNCYRPLYSNVTVSSYNATGIAYGYHFNITHSGFSQVQMGSVNFTTDSNAYYVFRNNTGTYLSVTFLYSNAGSSFPTNPVIIPPANSVTMMITNTGSGGASNYVLF